MGKLLTKKDRRVLGILSFGTFLEYFDFYLYVHFSVILNNVFFGSTDAKSNALLTSFSYCVSFLFRPIGAIVLGYIGDTYGRKAVINITFILMGIACFGIFLLPSYEVIGAWASVMITLFRIMQSISSMGEIIGGEIYLIEYMKGKTAFVSFGILDIMASVACQVALFGIGLSIQGYFDFRYMFLVGMLIFVVGYHARKDLVESPDYLKATVRNRGNKETFLDSLKMISKLTGNKTYIASFFIDSMPSIAFFLSIVGLNDILRNNFGFSEEQIINRNIYATCFCISYGIVAIIWSTSFNPIIMTKFRNICTIILFALTPYILTYHMSLQNVLIIKFSMSLLCISDVHIGALVFKNIPVLGRFRTVAWSFALSRAIIAAITSFGLVLLKPYLGYYVYAFLGLPFALAFFVAIRYFEKIDLRTPDSLLKYYK